jgi:hypothetical protein
MGSKRRPFRGGKAPAVGPFERRPIPPDKNPDGAVEQMHVDALHVVLVQSATLAGQRWVHLAIRRKDSKPLTDHWRTLMRIKDLLLGPEAEAVELYPDRSRLVDDGNDYHLWSPVGVRFGFGLSKAT